MKKSRVLCAVLICLVLLAALAGCSNSRIAFNAERYVFYMDSATLTLVPTVTTRPKGEDYTLTSANPTIVRVLDDGITLQALRTGMSVITATCTHGSATAYALVYPTYAETELPGYDSDGNIIVVFNTSYGSVPSQKVAPGGTLTRPDDPYRAGYRVIGWYTDAELTQPFDFSTPIYEPLTLYPKWEAVPATYLYTYLSDTTASIKGLEFAAVPYEEIELPSQVGDRTIVAVENDAFRGNTNLQRVAIPDTITKIGSYAFAGCTKLQAITGGENLTSIGEGAFWLDSQLTECPLPDSITELGGAAFSGCIAFAPTALPAQLTVLSQQLFENSGIRTVDLSGIEKVEKMCFYGSYLETVTGTQDLTTVESQAFYATPWMQAQYDESRDHMIYLDDILLYLDYAARTDVTVKEGTRLIANYAFYHYYNIRAQHLIIRLPSVPPEMGVVHTTEGNDEAAIPYATSTRPISLVVPEDSYETYATTPVWSNYYVAPENDTGAFHNMYWFSEYPVETLNVLVRPVPASDTAMPADGKYLMIAKYTGDEAVFNVHAALEAAYPEGYRVTNVLTTAFYGRQNLTTLIMPARVDKYEQNCINDCEKLTAMYIAPYSGNDYPTRTQLTDEGHSWSVVSRYFAVYVPEEALAKYQTAWYYNWASLTMHGYTAEEYEAVVSGENG